MSIQGNLSNNSWEVIISHCQFTGKINNNPFLCYGKMSIGSNNVLHIPMFLIKWGSSVLKIHGGIKKNDTFDISVIFKKINFANFFTKLDGNIDGHFKLHGCISSPIVSLNIRISSIVWKNQLFSIKKILINGDVYPNELFQSNLVLVAHQIQYQDILLLYQLYIQGKGNINQHCLNIEICGRELLGKINVLGRFNSINTVWYGKICKTDIITFAGTWKLMKDIEIIYQQISGKLILKSHDWKNIHCKCIVSEIMQKKILKKINSICQRFNLNISDSILVNSICIDNLHISCTDLHWFIHNNILCHGTIFITGSKLSIRHVSYKKKFPVIVNNIRVRFVLNQNRLLADWVIFENTDNSQNYGNFCISDLYNTPKILGKVYIKDSLLISILQFLLQSQISFETFVNVNINFSGYLYSPKIYGVIDYMFNNISAFDASIFIKNHSLKIVFLGDYATVSGLIETNYKEKFYFKGSILNFFSISKINLSFNLIGNQCRIYLSPMIFVTVSPNINCIITANNLNVKGDIDIPCAKINIQEIPKDLVRISSEEIIINAESDVIMNFAKDNFIFNIFSSLSIHFGDNVDFNGLGLHTKLKGNLEVIYDNNSNNNLTLMGHVNIFSGYLEAYGQNLVIRKGQLLFSGSINQVYLDIEVIRHTEFFSYIKDSITAGIQITGMLDQLKLDFFSNSISLSQQEIASYLLRGNHLLLSDINEANTITSLLIGMSTHRYKNFISKIGHLLGVKDLKINTQSIGSLSLVSLSGYIAPGLQLKYGINIFDLLTTTVTIRYYMNPYFYLEATSCGRYQGLDLLYRFHF